MNRINLLFRSFFGLLAMSFITLQLANAADELPDFAKLFEDNSPAVVNISTLASPKSRGSQAYGPGSEEIPEIFRRYFGVPAPEMPSDKPQPASLGSGFIVSKDGYILTNNHVIEGAEKIIVRLHDRSEKIAELIGADKRSDLALLKIDTKENLPVVRMGNSEKVKPGEWVAAIGSPFNFEYSITKGIVSALNRGLPNEPYVPFIQTDVPINPGNSGGPLFNMSGEVIGINSQIFTRSGGFMGLSFAIPAEHVEWAVAQLKEKGSVTRGWLGVGIQEVDRDLAESFNLGKPMGALVSYIVPGGPADKAKFQPGDIIVKVNDREITRSSSLPMEIGVIMPGDKAAVTFIRNGKKKVIQVEAGELPDEMGQTPERSPKKTVGKNRLGIQAEDLNDDYRNKLQLKDDIKGVVVTGITTGVGRNIGLRQGDVITDIYNTRVSSIKEFKKVVGDLPKDRSISMRVIRRNQSGYISFRLTE